MDKILKLYTYVDGVNDTPFPQGAEEPIEIGAFRYDAKRMGGAPSITATVNSPSCLDRVWTDNVYATFNGEKYYLKQTPTSSYDNESTMYKHNLELVSERRNLDNIYFFDTVVGKPTESDAPVSNSTTFHFYGNIEEFVKRLNASLQYSSLQKVEVDGDTEIISGYHVVIDNDITSEDKEISFDSAAFSQALQECYNTFGIPYYFVGKQVRIGFTNNAISDVFEYGVDNALLSISKQNSNFKVVNRATGYGSSENIPFYYPNNSPKGEIEAVLDTESNDFSINVFDFERYSNRVPIDGVLKFVNHPYEITNISYGNDYVLGDEITEESNLPNYSYSHKFKFSIEAEGETSIDFTPIPQILSIEEGSVDNRTSLDKTKAKTFTFVTLLDDNGKVLYKSGSDIDGSKFQLSLPKAGNYSLVVDYRFTHPFYRDEKNTIFVTFYLDATFASVIGWTHNGDPVELNEVGIRYEGTPSVGDTITQKLIKYVKTSDKLMPSIYRTSDGAERFYNAVNNKYPFPYVDGYKLKGAEYVDEDGNVQNDSYKNEEGDYYEFKSPYIEGKPKEHVFNVDDIKPTIKETTVHGLRIDMFSEFAYDKDDNDETYEDDNGKTAFKHPYFFGKLRRLDFNLFDHAIEQQAMTISMTSGHCGACNFEIGVSEEEPQANPVQIYLEDTWVDGELHKKGSLVYDENGRVLCGLEDVQDFVPVQDEQQDTINYEVWIALKKEENTYGILMPKAPKYEINEETGEKTLIEAGHRPKACTSADSNDGDTFVITGIYLPQSYIRNAEKRLEKAIVKYISENNDEKFNFSVNFSRIFLAENPRIRESLNENARINIKYNGVKYTLYASSCSYTMQEGDVLPEIRLELDDTLTIAQNAIQRAIDGVKGDIAKAMGSIDIAALGSNYFVRKDSDDTVQGVIDFRKGIMFGEGGEVTFTKEGGAKLTIDYLDVTKKATFTSLEIQERSHVGGQLIVTPASMICNDVEELEDSYRCYFQADGEDGEEIFNQFAVGDQAICQTFNAWGSKFYWRLVTSVGRDYIELSKDDCATDSDIPSIGDRIIQLGNREIEDRQNAIIISSHGEETPSLIQYKGINSYNIESSNVVTKLSPNENIITGVLHIREGSDGIENITGLPEFVEEAVNGIEVGGQNMLRNSGFTGDYLSEQLADDKVLNATDAMFNPPLVHWDATNVEVVEEAESASGYCAVLTNGSMTQNMPNKVIVGETYMLSFKAKGDVFMYNVGGLSENVTLTEDWQEYRFKIEATANTEVFNISARQCSICELQLERGTVATGWSNSPLDNRSDRAYYQSMQYLASAIDDGSTTIGNGLVLTRYIAVGNYARLGDDAIPTMIEQTGGMNGAWVDNNSPFLFGGGNEDKATYAINFYKDDPTKIATDDNISQMANFVVTHGGRAILNDAIVRGTIYASGGRFSGKIDVDATSVNGRVTIDNDGFNYYYEDGDNEKVLVSLGKTCSDASATFVAKDGEVLSCSRSAIHAEGGTNSYALYAHGDVCVDGSLELPKGIGKEGENTTINGNLVVNESLVVNGTFHTIKSKCITTGDTQYLIDDNKSYNTIFVLPNVTGTRITLPSEPEPNDYYEFFAYSQVMILKGNNTIYDIASNSDVGVSFISSKEGHFRLLYSGDLGKWIMW